MTDITISFGDDDEECAVNLDETPLGIATALVKRYGNLLAKCTPYDTNARQAVRDQMLSDETFVEHATTIETLVEGKMDWINSIIRAEARKCQRARSELLERLRLEREREREAEVRREHDELASIEGFGAF